MAESAVGELTPERVFRDYAPRVYNLARRMLGNDADAEDVTQDVLLQVVRKLDTFRGESSLPTWLHRVTVNAALAVLRKRARRHERQVSEPMEQFPIDSRQSGPARAAADGPQAQVLGRELRRHIERAIPLLAPLYRHAYVLADVEGLANAEVGELLGLSLPAVKSRLHGARLLMRAALEP